MGGELGSVFEDEDPGRPRGPDLRVSVEVPRAALGATLRAPVPTRIAADGELVERVIDDPDDPERIVLHLPESLPSRTMLRLRGQGGAAPDDEPDARPGDLLVVVELVERTPRADETITREVALAPAAAGPLARVGTDITWWILLALALAGGAVVAAVAL